MNETYLGDGLYVHYEGDMIVLRAPRMIVPRAPREDGDHFVVLEPTVYRKLLKFVETQTVKDP